MPSDSHDLLFLKTKVCILCPRGFEIMDLSEYVSSLFVYACVNAEIAL